MRVHLDHAHAQVELVGQAQDLVVGLQPVHRALQHRSETVSTGWLNKGGRRCYRTVQALEVSLQWRICETLSMHQHQEDRVADAEVRYAGMMRTSLLCCTRSVAQAWWGDIPQASHQLSTVLGHCGEARAPPT